MKFYIEILFRILDILFFSRFFFRPQEYLAKRFYSSSLFQLFFSSNKIAHLYRVRYYFKCRFFFIKWNVINNHKKNHKWTTWYVASFENMVTIFCLHFCSHPMVQREMHFHQNNFFAFHSKTLETSMTGGSRCGLHTIIFLNISHACVVSIWNSGKYWLI